MLLTVFSIYDSAVEAWMPPMYFRNKGEAVRWWEALSNDSESKIAKHPRDYALFELGVFDDANAQFKFLTAPRSIGLAQEFVKSHLSPEKSVS